MPPKKRRSGRTPSAATTAYAYDVAKNLKSVTLSNGNKTSYFYDGMNRLIEDQVTDNAANVLADFQYGLRADGLRSSALEEQRTSSTATFSTTAIAWKYDADGRSVRETRDAGNNGLGGTVGAGDESDTYGFDLAGNRVYKDVFYDANAANAPDPTVTAARGSGDGKIDYTYNGDDQLLTETAAFTGSHSPESYTTTYGHINGSNIFAKGYDANGSLLESHRTGNTAVDIADVYDLQNRLVSATTTPSVGAAMTALYAYDSDGNRIKETTNGTANYFVNDLANPTGYSQTLEEKSAAGDATAPTRSYVIGQQIIAQSDAANGKLDFLYDGHGSTRALILDATGQVATGQIFAYDAYGNRKDPNQSIVAITSRLYTGERFDTGLGMYFWRTRPYNSSTGTWSQRDPQENNKADPLSLHKYLYADGNPVSRGDPSGHFGALDSESAATNGTLIDSAVTPAFRGGLQYSVRTLTRAAIMQSIGYSLVSVGVIGITVFLEQAFLGEDQKGPIALGLGEDRKTGAPILVPFAAANKASTYLTWYQDGFTTTNSSSFDSALFPAQLAEASIRASKVLITLQGVSSVRDSINAATDLSWDDANKQGHIFDKELWMVHSNPMLYKSKTQFREFGQWKSWDQEFAGM